MMLELKNIYVKYGNQIIYNHADLEARHNQLTLIIGKSGSGKSTLHHILTFQETGKYEYFFNNQSLNGLSDKQQKAFIKEKMGIVNQSPIFIDDLTIAEHIALCQSLWQGYNVDEYIDQLEIREVMNEYPQELSGGEKIRVSILLAMIHQPEILVFDEPTASLDRHHTQMIVQLLKKYAHQGHIVIIFTHDALMKKEGNVVYQIEDKILKCVQHNNQQNEMIKEIVPKKETQHYIQYIYKMFQHRKLLKIFMVGFVSFAIALSCFSILYGYSVINKYQNQLLGINKAGVLYRENNNKYSSNQKLVIGNEELENLHNIDYISHIWPYIIESQVASEIYQYPFQIYQNKELIANRKIIEEHLYGIATYDENYNYSKNNIMNLTNADQGIYIDSYFLYYLMTGEYDIPNIDQNHYKKVISSVDEKTEIVFYAPIPYYIETGENGEDTVHQMKEIRMKVKGIYTNSIEFQLGKEYDNGFDIFYPLSAEEQYRKELSQQIVRKQDLTDNSHYNTIKMPFQPMYYQFSVKDGFPFSKAKEDIEALGYKVVSEYYNQEVKVAIAQDMNEGILLVSGLIMCVVLMLLFGVKYNQKKEYINFIHFFTNRGLTYQEGKKLLRSYFIYEAFICIILSLIFMGFIIFFYYYFINPDVFVMRISFLIYCIFLAFIIEVIIPLLMIRGVKND